MKCKDCLYAKPFDSDYEWEATHQIPEEMKRHAVTCSLSNPQVVRDANDGCAAGRHKDAWLNLGNLATRVLAPHWALLKMQQEVRNQLDNDARTLDTLQSARASFLRVYTCLWLVWRSQELEAPDPRDPNRETPQGDSLPAARAYFTSGWQLALRHVIVEAGSVLHHLSKTTPEPLRDLLLPFTHSRPEKFDEEDSHV